MEWISGQSSRTDGLLIVCFCAAWCDTCAAVREALARIAARDSRNRYLWLDIEDDAALAGDIEVENFPTFAIYRGGQPLFFGVSPPQEGVIARTLATFEQGDRQPVPVPEPVCSLFQRLA